ncbi:CE5 acetyl xylan esterase AXE2 [Trichoderma parareesei]|uniref:CE5 acetyl xylan esterase AXE2 n=1 Tax=Trichoderma parareesei TaxID=858221 RepID=A0A2H2ZY24_TRIPA|nr:CE5 acetyl xylan esterase AXE2 [Trichoderma parareesei]
MRALSLSLSLSLSLLAASSTSAAAAATTCAKGLYMVVARGSEEPAGTGVTGNLTSQIAARVPGSEVVAVDYPASFDDYEDSEGDGVKAMRQLLNSYAEACPGNKIAVLGYSQGAQVATDTICGGAGDPFTSDKGMSDDVMDDVVAVAIFGDPTHIANMTYDRGTSIHNGLFNRSSSSIEVCKSYASRIVSYCDTGDIYCDAGTNSTVHHMYLQRYGDEIVDFVVSQFEKSTSSGSGSGSGINATTTTAPAPTVSPTTTTTSSGGNSTVPTRTGGPTTSSTQGSGANALTSSLMLGGLLTALTAVSQML